MREKASIKPRPIELISEIETEIEFAINFTGVVEQRNSIQVGGGEISRFFNSIAPGDGFRENDRLANDIVFESDWIDNSRCFVSINILAERYSLLVRFTEVVKPGLHGMGGDIVFRRRVTNPDVYR